MIDIIYISYLIRNNRMKKHLLNVYNARNTRHNHQMDMIEFYFS